MTYDGEGRMAPFCSGGVCTQQWVGCLCLAAGIALMAGLCCAQEGPAPSFHVQTELVTVPFQVHRGSRSVADLKASDVVLLEDGVPRSFTIFEAPAVHLTLDLAVMFDVTNPKATRPSADQKGNAGFWDAEALRDLAGYWSEAIARRLLDGHEASIRFSIYRFDQVRLERLCQTTSDPKVLVDALHRLTGASSVPQAAGQDVNIPLPAGLTLRNMERKAQAEGHPPQPWSLAGALAVLKDSAGVPAAGTGKTDSKNAMAAQALVIFSTGAEGSSITPEDIAEQAIAGGVAVYPVALPGFPWLLPYEGYTYRAPNGTYYFYPSKQEQKNGNELSMFGPAGAHFVKGATRDAPSGCGNCGGHFADYYNYPFELLGDVTGGRRFDAASHFFISGEEMPGLFLSEGPQIYSMTGNETLDVLERAKKHALDRFSSTYTVGFAPSPAGAPRQRQLEVKLASKSSSKVTEGKRSATY